jgi:hypothetical protein
MALSESVLSECSTRSVPAKELISFVTRCGW